MLTYFLKVIFCTALFYGLYALLFRREKMLVFNRFYLLGSLAVSFIIPSITFKVAAPSSTPTDYFLSGYTVETLYPVTTEASAAPAFTLAKLLVWGVAFISLVILLRLIINFYKIRRKGLGGKTVYYNNTKLVLLEKHSVPYSFWDTIYLNKKEFEDGAIEHEIIEHEMAHIRQKHSLDILFIEFLTAITWFNPILYLYKRAIKINHELLADAAVTNGFQDVVAYQNILLQRASGLTKMGLASSFNFILTKKRIIMLQKQFNRKRSLLLGLTALPVMAIAIFMGCNTIQQKESETTSAEPQPTLTEGSTASEDSATAETVPFSEPKSIKAFPEGPGASDREIEEYNAAIAKGRYEYGNYVWGKGVNINNTLKLYEKMTYDQRKNAAALPPPPPPPPLVTSLSQQEFDEWPAIYEYTYPGEDKPYHFELKSQQLPKDAHNIVLKAVDNKLIQVLIFYKDKRPVSEDVSTPDKIKEFEKKYGIPLLPPPPVPAAPPAPKDPQTKVPPPPPAPTSSLSEETISKLSEWPVILESASGKSVTAAQLKGVKVPSGFDNVVFKFVDEKPEKAFLVSGKKIQVVDIATVTHRQEFEKKFGIKMPDKIPAIPL